jgi:glycosyltransferase involved in cell wall biosynthesis
VLTSLAPLVFWNHCFVIKKEGMLGVLYITYDGILEPLGQSQVLSYLEKLSENRTIYLISFEKQKDKKDSYVYSQISKRINESNITWYPLTYHKNFTALATLWDVLRGMILSFWLVMRHKLEIVHARSYVPSIMALMLKRILNVYFIFDMRGFWADERIDGDIWKKNSRLYRISKYFEKKFLLNADVVVSLTKKAVEEMKKFEYLQGRVPNIKVITTCTNLELFKPASNVRIYNKQKKVLTIGYVGSVGVWYLFEEALDYFKLIQEVVPNARLHIVNKGSHDYIYEYLDNAGISKESYIVEESDHVGVVKAMQSMDAGIFIIKPLYSKISSMPTKLGEFLACGVPCICNSGVGDVDEIINNKNIGIVLNSFDRDKKRESIDSLLKLISNPQTKRRCREVASQYFSLEGGINAYNDIYHSLDIKS